MVDCGPVVWIFVTGGRGCVLPDAGFGVCNRCANGVAVFGYRVVVPVAAPCKYRTTAVGNRIKNRMEMEKIKNNAPQNLRRIVFSCFYSLFYGRFVV